MNTNTNQALAHFEELVAEIDIIATTKFKPDRFIQSHQLHFLPSYDDLDYLSFTSVSLPSGAAITLVRHQNAPYSGTEIRVAPGSSSPSNVLTEALDILHLSPDNLDWIHPLLVHPLLGIGSNWL